jgi:hypothetical protein
LRSDSFREEQHRLLQALYQRLQSYVPFPQGLVRNFESHHLPSNELIRRRLETFTAVR